MSRMVPTTKTKITANITAYSAISWPCSSDQSLLIHLAMLPSDVIAFASDYHAGSERTCQMNVAAQS